MRALVRADWLDIFTIGLAHSVNHSYTQVSGNSRPYLIEDLTIKIQFNFF
jgi:hypothetical protein